jgi:16S rRNA (guanine1516-N2)-methyltransferase
MKKPAGNGLYLTDTEKGLTLESNDGLSLTASFSDMKKRIKQNELNRELIVKAAKIKGKSSGLTVADATAGLGTDSFLLAAAGFNVMMFERDEVIAALVGDALERAKNDPDTADAASRMTLICDDSITALQKLTKSPDIVFLDPMFPQRTKSALIKKKFQLLQRLESPCSDEHELLNAAIACNPRRIVIKRPSKGPFLADRRPDYSINGSTVRYDCIVLS